MSPPLGRGLTLAAAKQTFLIGFTILVAVEAIVVAMIQLCIFCCFGKKKSRQGEEQGEDSAFQLAQMYNK